LSGTKNQNMKKIIIAIAILFGINSADAQVKYGLKAGLNVADLNVDEEGFPSTSPIANLHVGGFAEIKLNKKIAFQPELVYSAQGTTFDFPVDDGEGNQYNAEATFKLSYINVPLMLKYYPESKFYLEGGPQVGFLTAAKLKIKIDGIGSDTQDANEAFKGIDFGFNFGAGYNISKHATINARYNLGISNIGESEPGESATVLNRVFSISMGYIF
jgi:hypothetical protein